MKRIVAETKKYVTELFHKNSKDHLLYHNLKHTQNVVKAVKVIGKQCGVDDDEMTILQVAAWFHDVGYLETADGHEEISKRMAREFLEGKGMDEDFIAAVERCIDATKMPQHPTDKLSAILCDADLYHISQDKFMKNTWNLWKEVAAMDKKTPDEKESLKKTLRFLKDHHFHTEYGEALLETGKKENMKKVKAKIQKKEKKMEKKKRLALVENDPWLEPVEQEIEARLQRYTDRLGQIEQQHGSLTKFADAYKYFGIHYDKQAGGWYYREWAPAAFELFLFGDFNDWNRTSHPLTKKDNGVWEIFLDEKTHGGKFVHGSKFKVLVHAANGWKERIPAWITRVVQDENTKDFAAQVWMPPEPFSWKGDNFKPGSIDNLLIYECHVGMAQEKPGVGTYLEFTENVLPRIKDAGYNTIQLMAIAEHPYYGSFGYHVSSFFAPSSRFGTPEELKTLIKTAHGMGIAVIMDLVHSHTVKNIYEGLNEFDGTDHQYTHPGERGNHPAWDSKLFDYGKPEVQQFLLSNIKYWMDEFRFDGFRFDGVTSMIYLHHGYTAFDSREKYFTDGVEWDALIYLQLANTLIHTVEKDAVSIAEDVSGMPGLCSPINDGGIGFDYRLAMGIPDFWIRMLKEKKDEDWNMNEIWSTLTDRLPGVGTIAYVESHDQALVGDKTLAFRLMDKEMYFHMHKDDQNLVIDRGMALHKMIRMVTIALGGDGYLNFMGNEFGHPEWVDFPREGNGWSYHYARRQWSLCDNPELKYQYLARWDKAMIRLVKQYKVLDAGYGNLINSDEWNKILVFEKAGLVFVFNFHVSQSVPGYEFFVPQSGVYRIILNSDSPGFGGHERVDDTLDYPTHFNETEGKHFLKVYVPNRTTLVFKRKQ